MSEQVKQDSQKTIVAFVAGLLIGGLLVYVFASPNHKEDKMELDNEVNLEEVTEKTDTSKENTDANKETTNTKGGDEAKPDMKTGKGEIKVSDQVAGNVVKIDGATFPNDEGWIGVRDFADGKLGGILGVARFSNEQGLIPNQVELLRSTATGKTYALVFYTESGDRVFDLAGDKQIGDVVVTFTAK
jgi:hypothetical protein